MPASKYVDPQQRAKVLYVRVSASTHTAVAAAAAATGVGPGDFLRSLIEREVNHGDHH